MCIYVWVGGEKRVESRMSSFEIIKQDQKEIRSIANMIVPHFIPSSTE